MKDVSKSTLGPGSSFHMLQGLHIKTWEIAHQYIFAINHQSTAIIYSLRCGPEIQLSHISRENTSGVAAPPIFSSAWLPTAFFGYATWQTLGLPSFFFAFAIFSEWNHEVFLEALLVCMWHQLIEGPSFFRMSALVHPHQTNSLKSHFLIPQSLPSEVFSSSLLFRAKFLEWGTSLTWDLAKILHCRIFRPKILHRQFHPISTVLVIKTQKNEWKWRNLHRWQKFYTAAGTDGTDKFQLCH